MFVQCSLCGGENRFEPGQTMLICSFCGASLALDKPREVERLILSHARDDAAAEASLRSHLARKERRRATRVATDFSFIPFSMAEDDDGGISLVPAAGAWTVADQAPYPPAGSYGFLSESEQPEPVVDADSVDPRAPRIVYLPVYSLEYEASGWRGRAAVVGESWQVVAEDLPPERRRRPSLGLGLSIAALFAVYFTLAKVTPGFFGRLAAVAAAASAGYLVFTLRERAKG